MKKLLTSALVLLVLTGSSAYALPATWNATATDGNWEASGTENNWSTGVASFPGSISSTTNTDVATFSNVSNVTAIAINGSPLNIKSIAFGSVANTLSAYTIGTTGGNALLLTSGGAISYASTTTSTNTVETINAPIVLEGAYSFTNSSSIASNNTFNFGGAITNGTASAVTLTLGGTGFVLGQQQNIISGIISDGTSGTTAILANAATWTLSGANTFSGGITINRGDLNVNNAQALGTGTLTFDNSSFIDNTSSGAITVSTNNALNIAGAFTFNGTQSLNLGTGAVNLSSATTPGITVSANTLTIGGVMSGTHGLTKGGAGTLVLTGASTYTGTTTLNAGILNIQNGAEWGTNGAITVIAGTLQVQGGITGGSQLMTLNGNGTATALENVSGNNSFAGNVTLASSSIISSDAGTLTLNGIVSGAQNLTKVGNGTLVLTGANTYSGSDGSHGTTVSAGTLVIGSSVAASTGGGALGAAILVLGDTNTTVNNSSPTLLIGGAFTMARAFTIGANTTTGTYAVGGSTDNVATFSGLITANNNFSVTQVATTGSDALNITGGIKAGSAGLKTVTFNNDGAVNVATAAIQDGSGSVAVSQTGSGVTTLSANSTYSGGTTISNGTVYANGSVASATSSTGTGNVTVNGGILAGLGSLGGTGGSVDVIVNSGGMIAPGGVQTAGGAANGSLTIGTNNGSAGLTLNTGAKLTFALGSGITSSTIKVTNTIVSFSNNVVTINDLVSNTLTSGQEYTLIDGTSLTNYQGLILGSVVAGKGTLIVGGLSLLAPGNGNYFADNYANSLLYLNNGDIDVDVESGAGVVPEPSTWALMFGGLGLLLFYQRKRRS